jgi:flagellar motor switch protein FliM
MRQRRHRQPLRPGRLAEGHHAALSIVGDTFARRLTLVLSGRLRTSVEARAEHVRQLTFGEMTAGLPNPASLTVVGLQPLAGTGVLHLSLTLAFALVERMCGGPGRAAQPGRRLSEVETTVLGDVIDAILAELTSAFTPLAAFSASVIGWQDEPQLLKTMPASCPLIILTMTLRFDEVEGALEVCLPFPLLEAALDDFAGAAPVADVPDAGSGSAIASTLMAAAVDVSVRFGPLTLTPDEILGLNVGDVVALRHPINLPLTLTVSDIPVLAGVAGRRGRRLACRIVEVDQENHR